MNQFANREDAGKQLAQKLECYKGDPGVVVVGLARGGVVTAHAIAQELHVPLDAIVVRKIGSPWNPEYALGAIAQDGSIALEKNRMLAAGVTAAQLQPTIEKELRELQRRLAIYKPESEAIDADHKQPYKDKIVILVDDGIATGSTMRAALKTVQAQHPKKIILAVPVAPSDFLQEIEVEVDGVINLCLLDMFGAIGMFYRSFEQTTDEQVVALLR